MDHTFSTIEDDRYEGVETYQAGYSLAEGGHEIDRHTYCPVRIINDDDLKVDSVLFRSTPDDGHTYRAGEWIEIAAKFNGRAAVDGESFLAFFFHQFTNCSVSRSSLPSEFGHRHPGLRLPGRRPRPQRRLCGAAPWRHHSRQRHDLRNLDERDVSPRGYCAPLAAGWRWRNPQRGRAPVCQERVGDVAAAGGGHLRVGRDDRGGGIPLSCRRPRRGYMETHTCPGPRAGVSRSPSARRRPAGPVSRARVARGPARPSRQACQGREASFS